MSSGKEHDKSTKAWAGPFTIFLALLFGLQSGLIGGAAFLVGGLWLSPDLDTHSVAFRRWGILQYLWWPYKKIIPHRSIFSHGLLLGTLMRIGYLLLLTSLILALLTKVGFPYHLNPKIFFSQLFQVHKQNLFIALVGLEASAWLHLIKDGGLLQKKRKKQSINKNKNLL